MYVTLKSLREHGACYSGYNKVVRFLQSKPFTQEDVERASYIRFKHNEPISLVSIVESNGLNDALWTLQCIKGKDRDLRLFAVWSARQVQHLMKDSRSITALDIAEKYANGEASREELGAAWAAAQAAVRGAAGAAAWAAAQAAVRGAAGAAAWAAARAAAWAAAQAAVRGAARGAARDAAWAAARAAAWATQKEMFIKMCKGEAPWQKS